LSTRAPARKADVSWIAFAAAFGFIAGMLVMAALVLIFPGGAAMVTQPLLRAAPTTVDVKPTHKGEPTPVATPSAAAASTPVMAADAVEELRERDLSLPVVGIKRDQLRDTFNEMRGASRKHEALDVLASRNTPVIAVEDGTIARLFLSDAGGITVYQFDPSGKYVYYYAHLERYADGLKEGDAVRRGQVIGYVGTTGNAPRETPHLHFAIFQMTAEKKWWQGTPIDPYSVLK
jgi:murein DD-endopeptidase MepM/ murein hydrolase activator NlpD